ncbi:MAG TPA: hypothetical protein VN726_22975 [Hanamia sp.]|nr:hypothetical protein [Hanamia sp.]
MTDNLILILKNKMISDERLSARKQTIRVRRLGKGNMKSHSINSTLAKVEKNQLEGHV